MSAVLGIGLQLMHCSPSPDAAPAEKANSDVPVFTKNEDTAQSRKVYKIKGPKDNQPPDRYAVVEWEEPDVRVTGRIETDETDNRPERIFDALVRRQKNALLRCARSEPELWYAGFTPLIDFSTEQAPSVSLESRSVTTRSGIAENGHPLSVRLTACIRRSFEESLKTVFDAPKTAFSFRLSISRPNPERYITVGNLERVNGTTDFATVDTSGNHLCGADRDGKVTCLTRDRTFPLPSSLGRFQKLSLLFENGCGLDFKGRIRCWTFGETIEPRFAPNNRFTDVSTGDKHACGISNKGRLRCWSLDKASMIDVPEGVFNRLSCGNGLVCAIDTQGKIQCVSPRNLPTWNIAWKQPRYAEVSVGGNFVCALSLKGEIECHIYAGDKIGNRMGRTDAPEGVFQKIDCGLSHACAIDSAGRTVCWGDNRAGQSRAPDSRYLAVSAGQFLSCGIRQSGALECWGNERLTAGRWE